MSLRDEVLGCLLEAGDAYVSGGQMAEKLKVSRTAIWKVMDQLKAEGAEIESTSRLGYRLVSPPDLFHEGQFLSLVKDCSISWKPQYFEEVDSTNNVAKSLAANGAPEGTVIISDHQTAGKGRLGKQFHSPQGGLYFSAILRPKLPLNDMMAVTACAASAVFNALMEFGITAEIKWVNDLFLNGRKICGILSEGSFNAETLSMDYLIIGIGINLHHDPHLPDELQAIVTDLETETGQKLPRFALCAAVLRHLETLITGIPDHTFLPIYTEHCMTIGRKVCVHAKNGEAIATAIGIAEDAGLIVALEDASQETIRTGSAVFVD